MNPLKLRLKIKFLQKKIDKEVEWNFGYCPNTRYFDSLTDEMDDLLEYAAENYPDVYEYWENQLDK